MSNHYDKKSAPKEDVYGNKWIYEFVPLRSALRIKDVITFSLMFNAQAPGYQIDP